MVNNDGRGRAKTRNPPTDEGLSDCLGSDHSEGNGLRPACKAVHTGEKVGESSGWWQGSNDINMDDIKSGIWNKKRRERSCGVFLYLGVLTLYARMSPATNIRIDSRPNKEGGDQILSCSDAGV